MIIGDRKCLQHFNEQVAKVKLLWNESTPSVHSDTQPPNLSQGILVEELWGPLSN